VVKLAERRDELEKLIEKQKRRSQPENSGIPQRESPRVSPAMPQQPTMPEQSGFSGMQPSMMGEEVASQPTMPEQQMPQNIPTPQQSMQPEMYEQEEAPMQPEMYRQEEMATISEPSFPIAQLAYNRTNIEEIESLIESVVEEKWRQAMESFQDINLWKEKARTEIISIKQELLRLEQRFENMEKSMIGRVHEYDKNILNVGAEIKAMEKVLQKILQPLAKNVRELEIITKRLKK
jgi:hypothetical protein